MRAPILASFWEIAEREYTNFKFDAAARTTARNLIFAIAVGIILAAFYMAYQKQVPGAIVRAILRAEAFSEENAKTAEELGLTKNFFIRHELKKNQTLKRLIKRVKTVETEGEDAVVRYYIPEDLKYRAEIRYDKKGNGLFGLIFTIVATVGLCILLIKLLPAILSLFDYII